MSDKTLTHKDLATLLGVSETTIKSYRRKFPEFIPLASRGKPLHFPPEAGRICLAIQDAFKRDLSLEETRQALATRFPRLEHVENIDSESIGDGIKHDENKQVAKDDSWLELDARVRELVQAQAETNQRLSKLHELFADYLTLHLGREDQFTRGIEQLQRSWDEHLTQLRRLAAERAEQPAPPTPDPKTPPPRAAAPIEPRRKRVRVENMYGGVSEYLLETAPDAGRPQASGAKEDAAKDAGPDPTVVLRPRPAAAPDEEFLRLPLVVRSEQGEYLGIAGRAERAFCLNDFLGLLKKSYPPPRHFAVQWSPGAGRASWRLEIEQSDAIRPERYRLELEPAVTPKGNKVSLLSQLLIDGRDAPTPNLYALIRRMKALLEGKGA